MRYKIVEKRETVINDVKPCEYFVFNHDVYMKITDYFIDTNCECIDFDQYLKLGNVFAVNIGTGSARCFDADTIVQLATPHFGDVTFSIGG